MNARKSSSLGGGGGGGGEVPAPMLGTALERAVLIGYFRLCNHAQIGTMRKVVDDASASFNYQAKLFGPSSSDQSAI